jgi:hypothetical protein
VMGDSKRKSVVQTVHPRLTTTAGLVDTILPTMEASAGQWKMDPNTLQR